MSAGVRDLISRIDRDTAATRVILLKNAAAREIATSLQTLAGGGQGGTGGVATSVVAIESSNAIALRGDPATVARLADIARDLDSRAASGSEIRVIFLQHADAAKLLPVLQLLVGQSVSAAATVAPAANAATVVPPGVRAAGASTATPEPSVTPASVGSASAGSGSTAGRAAPVIARYEGANAIIISAPAELQRTLSAVIGQLDTRREQVLVEAIIVEISDTAAKNLGVQFLLGGLPGSGVPFAATNYSNSAPNILTIAGAIGARQLNQTTTTVNGTTTVTQTSNSVSDTLATAAVNSILGAASGFAGFAGRLGNDAIFGAIINAVKSDTQSNILSTPSVMTLDNQEAKILVGQEIPITTGQALSTNFDNAFRTVQRENVGVQLEVKPQINAGGAIKLFLRQEVSSIAGPVSSDNSDLIINKREIETTVTVDDGEIIALGGLLDDNERRTIERIPLLSDIPGIGELFKSRSKSRSEDEPDGVHPADDRAIGRRGAGGGGAALRLCPRHAGGAAARARADDRRDGARLYGSDGAGGGGRAGRGCGAGPAGWPGDHAPDAILYRGGAAGAGGTFGCASVRQQAEDEKGRRISGPLMLGLIVFSPTSSCGFYCDAATAGQLVP